MSPIAGTAKAANRPTGEAESKRTSCELAAAAIAAAIRTGVLRELSRCLTGGRWSSEGGGLAPQAAQEK